MTYLKVHFYIKNLFVIRFDGLADGSVASDEGVAAPKLSGGLQFFVTEQRLLRNGGLSSMLSSLFNLAPQKKKMFSTSIFRWGCDN
jgi:hypothetical protein